MITFIMFSRYDRKLTYENNYACEYLSNFFEMLFDVIYFLVNLLIILLYLLSVYFAFLIAGYIMFILNGNIAISNINTSYNWIDNPNINLILYISMLIGIVWLQIVSMACFAFPPFVLLN